MTTRLNSDGSIRFLNIIPKSQVETIRQSTGGGYTRPPVVTSLFICGGLPFYSSFNCIPYKNKLIYYFNDNNKNAAVTGAGDKIKSAINFRKSSCFTLTLDLETGAVTRKMLFTNEDEPMAMVRHGMLTGNDLYIVAYKNSMLGKSSIKLGKITVK